MLFLVKTMCMIKAHKYSGRIFDKLTGEPLPFAYIYDHKGNFLSLSDEKGWFVIDIPAMDSIRINASSVGYMRYQMAFANNSKQLLLALSPISHELDVVEIKAVRNPISINHPYSQSNVYATKIEENISSSLIDALETVPGVYKKSEYHSPIILRGLGGKRILFMQDGNRVMGSTSTGFTGQTVNVFNIEKIEVIKGPASVRYGPGALGGIINLVSKPPFIQAGYSGRILGSYGTNNNESILLENMTFCNEHNSFNFGFRYQNASDMT